MSNISDYRTYNANMSKSLQEKLFFTSELSPAAFDTIIDFGCANGKTLQALRKLYPEHRLIGYDIDKAMLKLAKRNEPSAEYYSDWEDMIFIPSRTLILLSSVIHEVYSYGNMESIEQFWDRLLNTGFKYIVVRDMKRDHWQPLMPDFEDKVIASGYGNEYQDFIRHQGNPSSRYDQIHFLLKYRYKTNWDREVRENYFPLYVDVFLSKIKVKYYTMYQHYAPLPFIVNQVQKDFNIDISDTPTHLKAIFTAR